MAGYTEGLLWGCPQMNFKTNPPFNEMRLQYLPDLLDRVTPRSAGQAWIEMIFVIS